MGDLSEGQPQSAYNVLLDGVDDICASDALSHLENLRMATGVERRQTGMSELKNHFADLKKDIFENEEINGFDKFFLVCELPFTMMRKFTVPIPCEGYYCRALVALSILFSPLWIAFYAYFLQDVNLFYTGGYPHIEISLVFSLFFGYAFFLFAPSDGNELSMRIAVPFAFLGFVLAALWIDFIATQLVRLLTFFGVICGIPNTLMGLTVLAWGNSMGDLSANMTMAKKGLANMAITACFAGPVFNLLLGLGCGFSQLNFATHVEATQVSLPTSIKVGFAFTLCNCILVLVWGLLVNSGFISSTFGYVSMGLYAAYVTTSILLEYVSLQEEV